ncbi:LysR family transcriptional regulator [Nonomuraea sp. NPDC049158]|uniref:LysR family transcriptional regulator n=1 Tax=Nonomuraea sp. NPDC049158 TaxID=3155649 RepID=UPI003400D17F
MEVDQIATFLAIERHGGFTRASEALHVSQPAISRRIRLLEQELGAPLFERVGRGVLLTEAGQAFLPYAETLLTVMRDSLDSVRELSGGRTGQVVLAFVGTLAGTSLTRRLRGFRTDHPGVRLRVRTATSEGVSDLVRRGEAVLGLRYDEDSHPDIISTKTYDEELVAVAAPDHSLIAGQHLDRPLAAGRRLDAAPDHPLVPGRRLDRRRLAEHPWITFPPRPGEARQPYADALERLLGRDALTTTEIVPIDSLTAQIKMVEAGFGLALLPRSGVEDEVNSGRIHILDIAEAACSSSIPVVLIQRRHGFLSGAAKALRDLLLEGDQSDSGTG